MALRVACLPGDCIGPEVMAVAQRVLGVLAPDVELEDAPLRRGRDPADGRLAPADDARGVPDRPTRC